jgi:site-specific DNA-methyltransferase (adenine-specific)
VIEPVKIGNATLYLGDCREVLPTLGPVGLIITDPPYSSGARTDSEKQVRGAMLRSMEDADWFSHDAMTTWGFNWFIRSVFTDLRQKLAPHGHVYVFIDWRQTPNVYGMLEACGYRVNQCLVWAKTHFGMGSYWRNQHENIVFASNGMPAEMLDRGMGSVLTASNVSPTTRVHPTEKPVDLLARLIKAVPGDDVFDPFMGSGSTGVAAIRAGRRFIGCEINPDHFAVACKRIGEAVSQGDMFVEPAKPKAVQSVFDLADVSLAT